MLSPLEGILADIQTRLRKSTCDEDITLKAVIISSAMIYLTVSTDEHKCLPDFASSSSRVPHAVSVPVTLANFTTKGSTNTTLETMKRILLEVNTLPELKDAFDQLGKGSPAVPSTPTHPSIKYREKKRQASPAALKPGASPVTVVAPLSMADKKRRTDAFASVLAAPPSDCRDYAELLRQGSAHPERTTDEPKTAQAPVFTVKPQTPQAPVFTVKPNAPTFFPTADPFLAQIIATAAESLTARSQSRDCEVSDPEFESLINSAYNQTGSIH